MLNPESFGLLLARVSEESHKADAFDFNLDLTIFTIVIFLGLLVLLTKFAWKPLLEALEHREKAIADNIESAKKANEDAQANLKLYEKKLAEVAEQANSIVAEAKKDALVAKEKIVAETNQAVQSQRERAVAEIKAAKDAAVRELAEKSAETAVSLAGSIVGRSLNKDDHKKLIDESISGFVKRV
jgi:F-type H+-transporting ATPase subunit b